MASAPKSVSERRRAALITGGARRVGRVIAEHLAAQGFDIAIHCHRSEAEAISLCRSLREQHPEIDCGVFPADLSKAEEVQGLLGSVARSFPHLSVLVNNAAVYRRAPLVETPDEMLDEAWRVNVRAPLVLTREFARVRAGGAGGSSGATKGHVVMLLDSRIVASRVNEFAYEFSKRALASAVELLAKELAPGMVVNAIAPGAVLAPEVGKKKGQKGEAPANFRSVLRGLHNRGDVDVDVGVDVEKGKTRAETGGLGVRADPAGTPILGRHPTPEDVAAAVYALVSTEVMTGQTVFLDGGMRLG